MPEHDVHSPRGVPSPMTTIEEIGIPDSKLCKMITELVGDSETELLLNHSVGFIILAR